MNYNKKIWYTMTTTTIEKRLSTIERYTQPSITDGVIEFEHSIYKLL